MDRLQQIQRANVKGERHHNRITFNPNTAKMGEKLYVTIPALDDTLSIVPGTAHLIHNFKNSNDKSWPLNNLSRLLVQGLQVKLGRDIVYDNTGESLYRLYEDLWKSERERNAMVGLGFTSLETRKHLAGDDGASSSSTTSGGIKDAVMGGLVKNQRIQLGQILDNHGLHSPHGTSFETKYTITLPDNSENIGNAQSSQSVGNFSLENIEFEYDTITNTTIVQDQRNDLSNGKNYIVQHVSLESTTEWAKGVTLVNENLHINRESLKAIVYLFKWSDAKMDEDYVYPNITEVSCNVNGKPNVIHSNIMQPDQFEREARRFFQKDKVVEISSGKFFASQFCIVLDFRSLGEANKYNDGIKVDGSSGIRTTFRRTASTKSVKCYTFVVSDSIVQMDNTGYQKTLI